MSELEKRITRLEDIEAIKQLKARYCEICDDMHNPDRVASVFVEDAIWESADFGKAEGHDGDSRIISQLPKNVQLFSAQHHEPNNRSQRRSRHRHLVHHGSVDVCRK